MESTNISKPEETTVSSFEFAGRASLAEDDNGGNGDPTTIYGSGEDDRNGGEKKKTK